MPPLIVTSLLLAAARGTNELCSGKPEVSGPRRTVNARTADIPSGIKEDGKSGDKPRGYFGYGPCRSHCPRPGVLGLDVSRET